MSQSKIDHVAIAQGLTFFLSTRIQPTSDFRVKEYAQDQAILSLICTSLHRTCAYLLYLSIIRLEVCDLQSTPV